jgi:hypothetical protein
VNPDLILAAHDAANHVVATAYCMPDSVTNALDTAKLWAKIIAGGLAFVALVMVGIGIMFQSGRHDGGQMLAKLGWWIFGVTLASGAAGMVALFIQIPTDCVTP